MRAHYKASLMVFSLLLAACRSEPVRYYTLTPAFSAVPGAGQPALAVQLERVTVPPQVDRTQIVVRPSGNELVILDTQWWAANLADEVRSALNSQLNVKAVPGQKTLLRVDVQRFELVPGQYAVLDTLWRIRPALPGNGNMDELTCQTVFQTPSGAAVEDLVAAQIQNMQKLATSISAVSRSSVKSCP